MAQNLHADFPEIYKDPNPKAEIAIALDDNFRALWGFASLEMVKSNFEQNPVLTQMLKDAGLNLGQE